MMTTHGPRLLAAASLIAAAVLSWSGSVHAQKVNCANEFRSGKLYFSQKIYNKAVERFAASVEVCPDKSEYRTRYAIALAQYAEERLTTVTTLSDSAAKAALLDSVKAMITLAGSEFDSALAQKDCNKKIQKLVRENRKHFWVDQYNQGIKLNQESDYFMSALNFELARVLDASDPRAFSQGAIALINMDDKAAAADLVQQGLDLFPDDEKLNTLQKSIFLDAADDLTGQAEKEKNVGKAEDALGYLEKVQSKLEAPDPDILFKMGLAKMAAGGALNKDAGSGTPDSTEASARYRDAAETFAKAAALIKFVPDPKTADDSGNNDFHLACRFNQVQSLFNAGDYDATIAAIKEYLALKYDDPAIWQIWTFCLQSQNRPDAAAAAIMVSKSIPVPEDLQTAANRGGTEIAVADAEKNAKEDAAAALKELGPPAKVCSYQTEDGYQVDTWFWPAKRRAMSFVLGVKNGEMAW
jgi:tetratricopeptide (TPR) repeat protein